MQCAKRRFFGLLVGQVVLGCEFNAEIFIQPQSIDGIAAMSACPDSPDNLSILNIDLLITSDFDRLVEAGQRVSRGQKDHCTARATNTGDSDGDIDDPDGCLLSTSLGDAVAQQFETADKGTPVTLSTSGTLDYCDTNGTCGEDAQDGAPLHLAVVFDNGEEAGRLDPQNVRLQAVQDLVDPVLCASRPDLFPGCPFSLDDEIRFWTLTGDELREEGSWTSDPEAALGRIDTIQQRKLAGDGPIFDALSEISEVVFRRSAEGDGRAILLITTDGDDRISSATADDVPLAVPVHIVSLTTEESIGADLRQVGCNTGGSYLSVAEPSGYANAVHTIRYALRGRWRLQANLSGMPSDAGLYQIETQATLQVEGGTDVPNPQLTFQVQQP